MTEKELNKKLYEKLLDLVGTEDEIRSRQDIFKYVDIVNGFGDKDSISISCGSLAEGFDIKGSDEDTMLILKNINVVPVEAENKQEGSLRVNMEVDKLRPGYASLFLSEEEEKFVNNDRNTERSEIMSVKRSIQKSGGKCIVASARFRGQFIRPGNTSHGPCISDGLFDFAISLHGNIWPKIAQERITRCKSKGWLSDKLVNELLSDGCVYVPVGPRHFYSKTLWRISFAKSEKRLIFSMNHIQWLCYGLLKIVFKEGIGKKLSDDNIICSYFLKTCLFWLIEETDNDDLIWSKENLYTCYIMCLNKLIDWVKSCNCPNYIIQGNNMFKGKVNEDNKSDVLKILLHLKDTGFDGLTLCESLSSYTTEKASLVAADREANLDFLCFRVLHLYPFDDIGLLTSALNAMEKEYRAQENNFAKGVISSLLSSLHQEAAQMIDITKNDNEGRELRRLQREHLQKGCVADRLCGLILLASFHCTNEEHYTAIEILNFVTGKLKPEADLILRRKPFYKEEDKQNYKDRFCGFGIGLEKKLYDATVRNIVLLDKSSIVPKEFRPEVHYYRPLILIPPAVYAHALKFLCHYHLNEKQKAQDSLRALCHIVETRFLVPSIESHYSTACTVVGACYEVDGNYETARKYYLMALNCLDICRSTNVRLQRLDKHTALECN